MVLVALCSTLPRQGGGAQQSQGDSKFASGVSRAEGEFRAQCVSLLGTLTQSYEFYAFVNERIDLSAIGIIINDYRCVASGIYLHIIHIITIIMGFFENMYF